jgi:hypothetical protein
MPWIPGSKRDRLLKKAHLPRWPASPLAATYFQYASLGLQRAALDLDLFEQPGKTASLDACRAVFAYFTSSIFTTFSYSEKSGSRQPYFLILTIFPFKRTASFWMLPESNLNRYHAS